jgi:hypothetical protein
VLRSGLPSFGNLVKGKTGIVANSKVSNLGAKFDQTPVGELTVLGLERPAKLLVSPFYEGVIPATRLQTVEVLRHSMKH